MQVRTNVRICVEIYMCQHCVRMCRLRWGSHILLDLCYPILSFTYLKLSEYHEMATQMTNMALSENGAI
jgi:hypothetical protein